MSGCSRAEPAGHANDVAVEDEDLLVVVNEHVKLALQSLRESGLAGAREASEPVSGTGCDREAGVRSSLFNHLDDRFGFDL